MVARSVGAEQYNTKPVLENAFYTYWSGLAWTGSRPSCGVTGALPPYPRTTT